MRPSERVTLLLTVCLVIGATVIYDRWPSQTELPAAVQARITRHDTTLVVDTAAVNRLEREKAASRVRELKAAAAGGISDSIARTKSHEADSLAGVARAAQTSADSARMWQAAYESRTREAEELTVSRDQARFEIAEVRAQRDSTERQSGIWTRRALEGDSIIADLRPLAAQALRRWHVGVGGGYGCGARGCGPEVVAAVTYEVRLPKLSLPFFR